MFRDNFVRLLVGALLTAGVAAPGLATTVWFVDDDAPGDPGPGDPFVSDPDEDGSTAHPFDRMQEAIDAASNGDTVLVLAGTYHESIDFLGKAIVVTSASGPALTIIDFEYGPNSVVTFENTEGRNSVLSGFTITGGSGGGPTSTTYGGGVRIYQSSPTISGNFIVDNQAHFGGGVDCEESNPLIIYNVISGNDALDSHELRHLTGDGGGISLYNSTAEIYNNVIVENFADRVGGGISINGLQGSFPMNIRIENNLIGDNFTEENAGGGIYVLGRGNVYVGGCTIAHNTAPIGWSAALSGAAVSVTFENTILYGSAAKAGGQEVYLGGQSQSSFAYCNIAGGQPGIVAVGGATYSWGAGNLAAPPQFLDVAGGDFRVDDCSPCVNAGDPAFVPDPGELDLDGGARVFGPRVDIGAYERVYADANGDGRPDGCHPPLSRPGGAAQRKNPVSVRGMP